MSAASAEGYNRRSESGTLETTPKTAEELKQQALDKVKSIDQQNQTQAAESVQAQQEQQTAPVEPAEAVAETEETSIPVGYEVGMRAPDFTAEVYGENPSTFTLSEHRGKTVIVNFWATWCTPCCNELPHFDELYRKYEEDIVVIALHSHMVTDNVEEYLCQYDYQMPFGLDASGEIITSFNGSTMLPQTVVIDANGIITYNATGSVTYEMLEKLVSEAAVTE